MAKKKIIKKVVKKIDEREFITKEFYKVLVNARKKKIDDDYTIYLIFALTGGMILEESPQSFDSFVKEIKEANKNQPPINQ